MTKQKQSSPNPVLAALLACAIPGAGHLYLGRAKRGIIIFLTITALFWSGVGVGGVLTVDLPKERWWFVAQMLTGVNGLIAWQRQKQAYQALAKIEGESLEKRMVKAGIALVVPAETVARAYSGVAGLLNLMCIFDALMLSIMGVRGEPQPQDNKPKPKGLAKKEAAT
jgi:TM2 domain-containing membrane protein YozV